MIISREIRIAKMSRAKKIIFDINQNFPFLT